jgi:hypothetical protein
VCEKDRPRGEQRWRGCEGDGRRRDVRWRSVGCGRKALVRVCRRWRSARVVVDAIVAVARWVAEAQRLEMEVSGCDR